jgi:hypothetical protein
MKSSSIDVIDIGQIIVGERRRVPGYSWIKALADSM